MDHRPTLKPACHRRRTILPACPDDGSDRGRSGSDRRNEVSSMRRIGHHALIFRRLRGQPHLEEMYLLQVRRCLAQSNVGEEKERYTRYRPEQAGPGSRRLKEGRCRRSKIRVIFSFVSKMRPKLRSAGRGKRSKHNAVARYSFGGPPFEGFHYSRDSSKLKIKAFTLAYTDRARLWTNDLHHWDSGPVEFSDGANPCYAIFASSRRIRWTVCQGSGCGCSLTSILPARIASKTMGSLRRRRSRQLVEVVVSSRHQPRRSLPDGKPHSLS